MLRRLDDRLSTMLGTCWVDNDFDASAKFETLSAIPYTENPGLSALTTVCSAFFGDDSAAYFSERADKIVVTTIPAKYRASACEIVPYEFIPRKGMDDKHGPYITAAFIAWLPVGDSRYRRAFFNNTNEMLLQLCDAFINEGPSKKTLIEKILTANQTVEDNKRNQREFELLQKQRAEEAREKQLVATLIKNLVTDNVLLHNWIQEWKKTNLRDYPCSIKKTILDAILAAM
jgi:hypothetical protein